MAKARKYTTEFKEQAVRLAEHLGSVLKAARHLGVSEANVYNWKMKSKNGKLKDLKNSMSIQAETPDAIAWTRFIWHYRNEHWTQYRESDYQ